MEKEKHHAIYWLDSHQNMGVRQWTWDNKGAKKRKAGGEERDRQTDREKGN